MQHCLGHTPFTSMCLRMPLPPDPALICNLRVTRYPTLWLTHTDALTVPTSPTPGSLRKTAKSITFHDPLIEQDQPHCTLPHSSLRKTTKAVLFSDPIRSTINGTKCKQPSSSQQLPLPAPKVHVPHPLPQHLSQPLSPKYWK